MFFLLIIVSGLYMPPYVCDDILKVCEYDLLQTAPCGAVHPSYHLSIYFLIFSLLYFSLSFIGFTYFVLLSIPSLSTRIVPLRFQAGGRRKRLNLGLVCCVFLICIP